MGKLAELKALRDKMDWDHPDRYITEKKINSIEQWCIDNGNMYITKLTTWRKGQRKSRTFGFYEDEGFIMSGNFIVKITPPINVTSDYRCDSCNNICLHFTTKNYCVKCDKEPNVVNHC